jgi:hypothetical protein
MIETHVYHHHGGTIALPSDKRYQCYVTQERPPEVRQPTKFTLVRVFDGNDPHQTMKFLDRVHCEVMLVVRSSLHSDRIAIYRLKPRQIVWELLNDARMGDPDYELNDDYDWTRTGPVTPIKAVS